MMVGFAATFQYYVVRHQVQFTKLPVDLKKPLERLDHARLEPYKVRHAGTIPADVLNRLGTRHYIQWVLENSSSSTQRRPEDILHLFVTYYTGQPDRVPHVPEECYLGGGYSVVDSTLIDVPIPALGPQATIPIRILQFERSSLLDREQRIVMYTFRANGEFCSGRRAVQTTLARPGSDHAYFSKLELTFGTDEAPAEREAAIEAGKRFLQVVVPVLVEDHWPDWDQVTGRHADAGAP